MEANVRRSHRYHREDHDRDVTSLIAKSLRRGRRTITRETRVLPDPDRSRIDRYSDLQNPQNLPAPNDLFGD
jgi:hypothetical protein